MEIFGLDAWLGWFLIGMGLLIIEVAIAFTFYAAPIALGAFAASIVAAAGGDLRFSSSLSSSARCSRSPSCAHSSASTCCRRPPKRLRTPSGCSARGALTLERVDVDSGTVKLGDDVWSARTPSEGLVIDEGTRVEVVDVRGVYAYVEPMPMQPTEAGRGRRGGVNR